VKFAMRFVFPLLVPALLGAESGVYYVLNSKPASLAIVDAETLGIRTSIPLEATPYSVTTGPRNEFVYVLAHVPTGGGFFDTVSNTKSVIHVIDPKAGKVVKTIPAAWNTVGLLFSKDNRYLLCLNEGRSHSKKIPAEGGDVTVVDAQTNEVKGVLKIQGYAKQLLITDDSKRVFALNTKARPIDVISMRTLPDEAELKPAVAVFALDKGQAEAPVEFDHWPVEIAFSPDQRWLYALDRGEPNKKPEKNRNGKVHVIETATAKLAATHDLGSSPRSLEPDAPTNKVLVLASGRLHLLSGAEIRSVEGISARPLFSQRFEKVAGRLVVSEDEMRFLSDSGELSAPFVFNCKQKDQKGVAQCIGGGAEETLALDRQEKLVVTAADSIAILDLKATKVEHRISTGRLLIPILQGLAVAGMSGAVTGYNQARGLATPSPIADAPSQFFQREMHVNLAASPDQKTVYALNGANADVTAIDPATGTVRETVSVAKGSVRILQPPDSPFLVVPVQGKVKATASVFTMSTKFGDMIALIDTRNLQKLEHKVAGQLLVVHYDAARKRILGLSDRTLVVIDATDGHLVKTLEGFTEAKGFAVSEQ